MAARVPLRKNGCISERRASPSHKPVVSGEGRVSELAARKPWVRSQVGEQISVVRHPRFAAAGVCQGSTWNGFRSPQSEAIHLAVMVVLDVRVWPPAFVTDEDLTT